MKRMTRQGHTLTHPPATTVRLNNTASSRSMWACLAGGGGVTGGGGGGRSFACGREGPHSGGSGSPGRVPGAEWGVRGPGHGWRRMPLAVPVPGGVHAGEVPLGVSAGHGGGGHEAHGRQARGGHGA